MIHLLMNTKFIGAIVGIGVGLIVIATMLPTALNTLANSTTATAMPNVDTATRVLLASVVGIVAVVSIILYMLRGDASD